MDYIIIIYITQISTLYFENKFWDVLDKAKLVGEELCQGKNDFKVAVYNYGLFLAPKIKYCLSIDKHGIIQEHKTFQCSNGSVRLLDCSQYFEAIEGKKSICVVT